MARADLTGLLQAWSRGDEQALDRLAPLVHRELREMARRILAGERRDGRLQPTELVHESYLRLLESLRGSAGHIVNLGHGIMPTARIDCVEALVGTVTQWK